MPMLNTLDAQVAAGRALDKMAGTLATKKSSATRPQRFAVRKAFRDAAAFLKEAGYDKSERDLLMKPFQREYDPQHRTR